MRHTPSRFQVSAFVISLLLLLSFAAIETRPELLQSQLDLFGEFYGLMDKNFVDTLDLPDLMKRSMNKTLGELDPYSHYYDVEETKKRESDWKGILYAGIGSSVKQTDSGVVIADPYLDLPAMKAGLRTGDIIVEINSRQVQALSLDSVIKQLKGKEGDTLQLTIRRPYKGLLKRTLVRELVVNKAVPLYFMQSDSTGYIALSHFLFGASKGLKDAVMELKAKGAKNLVIDLRGNSGGSVEECTSALSAFLPVNSLVCSLRQKDSTLNYSYNTSEQPLDTTLPLILLTNRNTISSGEIFAGCLKDLKRAKIVGDRTYGKAFVQGTRFLKNGSSLYITVARYYTPNGIFIGAKGVEPDLPMTATDSVPAQLQAILNSEVITDFSIKYRNTTRDDKPVLSHILFQDFKAFYLTRLSSVHLPEESFLPALQNYAAAANLKTEIKTMKQLLPDLYRTELEQELKKAVLRRYYEYVEAGKLEYEHSAMFRFLSAKAMAQD